MARQREADLATVGGETLRQSKGTKDQLKRSSKINSAALN
jgi:hypothetical protein